jgi:transposase
LQIQNRLETQQILKLVAAYIVGASVRDLSGQFKINRTTVVRHLERHGVPRRGSQRKLTDEDVTAAAELYHQGWSLIRLGQHYGVDDETVRRALRKAGVTLRPRRGQA